MTAEQLRMAMALTDVTIDGVARHSGVSRGTVMRITKGLKVIASNRNAVKSYMESLGVIFIEPTDYFAATVAERR